MRYDLRLRIGYRYGGPVRHARHALRVTPRSDRGQMVEHVQVTLSPSPSELASEADFFGNSLDHLRFEGAHGEFSLDMRARVSVARGVAPQETIPLAAVACEAEACRDAEGASPLHHLGPSRLVPLLRDVTAYARDALGEAQRPGVEAVLSLARAIRRDFAYRSGSTHVGTGVADIFRERRGVCQDFAHLMCAGLRGCGVPAAYVSGFIRTEPPPGMDRLEGADAMHAWVDVWLGEEAGWVGFDPTNGCAAEDGHVMVARGRDYADAAPVDGVLVTSGPQSTWHAVDIIPLP